MAVNNVIKYIRRKIGNDSYDAVTYLGTEQRFVSALLNSNNNNLEEQFLIGTDMYTEMYIDAEGNQIVEKSFRKENTITDYYKVITTIYAPENQHDAGFYFDEDTVYLVDGNPVSTYNNGELDFNDGTFVSFVTEGGETEFNIVPNSYVSLRTDNLYYISGNSGQNSVLIATKTIGRKILSNGREAIKEVIENKLNS